MLKTIRIANLLANTTANGPGVRTVLHVAGCTLGCAGCFNKWMWPENSGDEKLVRDVVTLLENSGFPGDLTLSGGEPLQQSSAVLELVLALKARNWLKSLFIYTGLYEHEFDADARILVTDLADYVVAGRFIRRLRSTDRSSYASSTNQVIYKRGSDGVMRRDDANELRARSEIIVSPHKLVITGLSEYKTLEQDVEDLNESSAGL